MHGLIVLPMDGRGAQLSNMQASQVISTLSILRYAQLALVTWVKVVARASGCFKNHQSGILDGSSLVSRLGEVRMVRSEGHNRILLD